MNSRVSERDCKHTERFFCTSVSSQQVAVTTHYVFACSLCRSFFMSFDPEFAGRIRHEHWTDFGINFTPYIKEVTYVRSIKGAEGGYEVHRTAFVKY